MDAHAEHAPAACAESLKSTGTKEQRTRHLELICSRIHKHLSLKVSPCHSIFLLHRNNTLENSLAEPLRFQRMEEDDVRGIHREWEA
jgi:hypothetical protein